MARGEVGRDEFDVLVGGVVFGTVLGGQVTEGPL